MHRHQHTKPISLRAVAAMTVASSFVGGALASHYVPLLIARDQPAVVQKVDHSQSPKNSQNDQQGESVNPHCNYSGTIALGEVLVCGNLEVEFTNTIAIPHSPTRAAFDIKYDGNTAMLASMPTGYYVAFPLGEVTFYVGLNKLELNPKDKQSATIQIDSWPTKSLLKLHAKTEPKQLVASFKDSFRALS